MGDFRKYEAIISGRLTAVIGKYLAREGKIPSSIEIKNNQCFFWFGDIKNDPNPNNSPLSNNEFIICEETKPHILEAVLPVLSLQRAESIGLEHEIVSPNSVFIEFFKYHNGVSGNWDLWFTVKIVE